MAAMVGAKKGRAQVGQAVCSKDCSCEAPANKVGKRRRAKRTERQAWKADVRRGEV